MSTTETAIRTEIAPFDRITIYNDALKDLQKYQCLKIAPLLGICDLLFLHAIYNKHRKTIKDATGIFPAMVECLPEFAHSSALYAGKNGSSSFWWPKTAEYVGIRIMLVQRWIQQAIDAHEYLAR